MHLNPRSASARAQSAICVLAVTVGLTVAPALVAGASAESSRSSASACASAQAGLKQAKRAQASAKAKVVRAQKAVQKAKKAHKPARVKKARKALVTARSRYRAATRSVQNRGAQVRSACAPKPAPAGPAERTGQKISLLGLGNGLDLGAVDVTQLTALLENLLPGVTDNLSADQLTALLAGFNGATDLDPADVLALLSGVLPTGDITDLLGGSASPEAISALIEDVIGQLSGLAGDLPIPSGFDPTNLWDTFAGIFGTLSADQLGSLLALVTSAFGGGGDPFDTDQLTDLIDSLVPGISGSFDPAQLTSMLAGLNGGGLSAATLANLLGGQFSVAQLQQVIDGTAGQALLGAVVAQVMAQLGTAGGGGLELPGPLSSGDLAGLISTVTGLISTITSGGGVLPVVCGLFPIPVLCP